MEFNPTSLESDYTKGESSPNRKVGKRGAGVFAPPGPPKPTSFFMHGKDGEFPPIA